MPELWQSDSEEETYSHASIVQYEHGDEYRVHVGNATEVCEDSDTLTLVAVVDLPEPMTRVEACEYEIENVQEFAQHVPDADDLDSSLGAALRMLRE